MNIWVLNPYDQTPDQQATRTYEYAKQLVKRGHQVTVFASSFSHYKFLEEKLTLGEKWKVEMFDSIRFIWLRTFPYNKNNCRRAMNMLSHAWMAFWVGIRLKEKPDIIMGVSVPISTGFSAYILSLFKSARFYFEVRDLWPQTLVDLGAISDKSPITFAMRIVEKLLYRKAERIISVLPYAHEYIVKQGVPSKKIVWLPNGIDLSQYEVTKTYDGGSRETFTLMYIGGFASYHGIEVILEAARILETKCDKTLKFVLIGDGPERHRMIRLSQEMKLGNVEFRGLLPKSKIPSALGGADACIAVLRKMNVLKYGINPNKLFDYLASGRPILFAIESRNNPVAEAGAGLSVPAEDPEALSDAIIKLIAMQKQVRKEMGDNGFKYVSKHFDINILADRLENVFLGDYGRALK